MTTPEWPDLVLVDTFAAILCDIWEYSGEDPEVDMERAREFWDRCLFALEKEPWKDGKHAGDCMNAPMDCKQCFVRDKRMEARSLLKALNDLGFLSR